MCEVCASMQKAASWQDVAAKGRAIYATGGVQLVRNDPQEVEFLVTSSQVADEFPVDLGGPYTVILSKKSWEKSRNVGGWVQGFLCSCFVPGTPVTMADGTLRPIEDVRPGDMVLCGDGFVHAVTVAMRRRVEDESIVRLKMCGMAEELCCTAEHPFWTIERIRCKRCESHDIHPYKCPDTHSGKTPPRWMDAGELTPGMYIQLRAPELPGKKVVFDMADYCEGYVDLGDGFIQPTADVERMRNGKVQRFAKNVGHAIKRYVEFDTDVAYVFGLYLGDGNLHAGNEVNWSFGSGEEHLADNVIQMLTEHFGVSVTKRKKTNDAGVHNMWHVSAYSAPLYRLFKVMLGEYSAEKRISPELYKAPSSVLLGMVDGWHDSDLGCSVNRNMVSQMQLICLAAGRETSVRVPKGEGRNNSVLVPTSKTKTMYRLYWRENPKQSTAKRVMAGDGQWVRIENVAREAYSGYVYNLEVEGDHTYLVNGYKVHNCSWGFYHSGEPGDGGRFGGRMCSHSYSALLYATDNGIARGARGEFMNDRTASLNEPRGDEEGDVAWMAYVVRDGSDIDGNVDYSMDENPRTGWYASKDEAVSKAASELADDDLDVEWHGGLTPGRTLIPWAESWQAAVFVHRCEWDGYEWLPDEDYDVVDLPGRAEYTDPYVTRQSVVDELAGMLPPECDIDLSWAPMSYETFYVAYGSLKIRVSGHQANADYGPCDVYLDVEDYPIEYGGVAKLASDIRSEIESFVDEVAAAGDEAGNEGLWLPKGACRMSSEAVGYCARCGAYGKVDVADWLCTACKDEETFNALVAATFGGDKDSELWLEAHADPERLAAISEQMEVADCDGVRLATWGGHRAAFTDDWGRERTATRRFTSAEMQELDDEIEGRELHNASRLKANGGAL